MEKHFLKGSVRKISGRKVSTLRSQGILPGNVFGKKIKSLAVSIPLADFEKAHKEVGETGLLTLVVEGEKEPRPVLIANLQKHPVSDHFLHVDLHQVDLKEKVEAEVAVEVVGESPVEKQSLGTVVQYLNEIKVEALPTDLPEKFEVDAGKLTEVDQVVMAMDLNFDKTKVKLKVEPEAIVVKVEPPQKIVEEPVAAPAPTEEAVPAEGAPAPAEGEEPKVPDDSAQSPKPS